MTESIQKAAMRMNSAEGKRLLSLVRGGDFAHPGELEAIRMVFADLKPCATRRLLDIGCGLGGTAEEVRKAGLGEITGIDNDARTIEYATKTYPQNIFVCADAGAISEVLSGAFDVVYMFNSLYTMQDQRRALQEAASLCRPGSELRIFDYFVHHDDAKAKAFADQYEGSGWNPVAIEHIEELLLSSGWDQIALKDISSDYVRWYRALNKKIELHRDEIVAQAGEVWFNYFFRKYQSYARACCEGAIGGLILRAIRKSN